MKALDRASNKSRDHGIIEWFLKDKETKEKPVQTVHLGEVFEHQSISGYIMCLKKDFENINVRFTLAGITTNYSRKDF